jgi:putative flippase GtrA
MKKIAGESTGFLVGAVNTTMTYALFLVLALYMYYWIAYTVAFVVGIALSYVLNALFVFKGRQSTRAMFKFPFVYVLQISTARWRSSRSSRAWASQCRSSSRPVVMAFVLVRLAFHGDPAGAQFSPRRGPS